MTSGAVASFELISTPGGSRSRSATTFCLGHRSEQGRCHLSWGSCRTFCTTSTPVSVVALATEAVSWPPPWPGVKCSTRYSTCSGLGPRLGALESKSIRAGRVGVASCQDCGGACYAARNMLHSTRTDGRIKRGDSGLQVSVMSLISFTQGKTVDQANLVAPGVKASSGAKTLLCPPEHSKGPTSVHLAVGPLKRSPQA